MMKKFKKYSILAGALLLGIILTACGNKETSTSSTKSKDNNDVKEVVIGVCPGPYGDMVEKVISPLTEEKGYKLTTKLFNDYIQPNKALNSKNIDGNLFQHQNYLTKFAEDNKLDIQSIGVVPTLGMGIYSKKFDKLSDIKEGTVVSLPNDASNLARALKLLADNDLITINDSIDETKATVDDIKENKHNLEFKPLESAQLSRSLDNVDVALIPGNYSWAAKLDPADALALEQLEENYKNVFAVRDDEVDGEFGKVIKEVLASQKFKDAISKSDFKDFEKPKSWK